MGRQRDHRHRRDHLMITHIKTPNFPEFRFEWHPEISKVYLIRASAPTIGECISEHANDHGLAFGFVQTWLRGYRAAATPKLSAA